MEEFEYEEKILKEFNEAIDRFQKKNVMESTSMIRLLLQKINDITNQIDLN